MSRLLQSTVRTLSAEPSDYLSAWSQVVSAAASVNAHAWIFRAVDSPDTFIEFIEWKTAATDPGLPPQILAVLPQLERFGPADTRHWQEL